MTSFPGNDQSQSSMAEIRSVSPDDVPTQAQINAALQLLHKTMRHAVQCYAEYGYDEKEALVEAGFKESTARRKKREYFDKAEVKHAIDLLRKRAVANSGATAAWIRTTLVEITRRCMQGEPVLDDHGNPVGDYKFDSTGAVRALDTLNRMNGNYETDNKQKQAPLAFHQYLHGQKPGDVSQDTGENDSGD